MGHAATHTLIDDEGNPRAITPTRRAVWAQRGERWWPFAAGILAASMMLGAGPSDEGVYDALRAILGSLVTVSASAVLFIGFMLTATVSAQRTEPMRWLRRTNTYRVFISYHAQAILWMAATLVVSIGLLAAQGVYPSFEAWSKPIAAIAVFTSVIAGCATIRLTALIIHILRCTPDPDREAP